MFTSEGDCSLHPLRCILAMLIALSLAATPVAAAWAAAPTKVASGMNMHDAHGMAMDCAKMAKAADKKHAGHDCCCCDSKSKCAQLAACILKCGSQVIGIVVPAIKFAALVDRYDRPSDPQEPPDRSLRPPAPPPRA